MGGGGTKGRDMCYTSKDNDGVNNLPLGLCHQLKKGTKENDQDIRRHLSDIVSRWERRASSHTRTHARTHTHTHTHLWFSHCLDFSHKHFRQVILQTFRNLAQQHRDAGTSCDYHMTCTLSQHATWATCKHMHDHHSRLLPLDSVFHPSCIVPVL